MKKIILPAIIFSLLFTSCLSASEVTSGEPSEIAKEGSPVRKLQRGFLNITLSPIEISHEMSKVKNQDIFPPSWAGGLGRGSCYMLGRVLVGAYEMLTFPLPVPAQYAPLLEPEFPWQHLDWTDHDATVASGKK